MKVVDDHIKRCMLYTSIFHGHRLKHLRDSYWTVCRNTRTRIMVSMTGSARHVLSLPTTSKHHGVVFSSAMTLPRHNVAFESFTEEL
jgi:hypothetical protein